MPRPRGKLDLSNPMLTAVLSYAETGWPVFPLKPGAKQPMTIPALGFSRGFKDATTDRDRLTEVWTRYPEANIGVAIPEGVVPIDIDGDHDLTEEELPEAPSQRTSKGEHRLYRSDGRLVARKIRVRQNVDLVTNGYIVGAPSVHPDGSRYDGFDTLPRPELLPEAPEWVYERAGERDGKEPRPTPGGDQVLVTLGSRDVQLASMAGTMRNLGFGPGPIQAAFDQLDREGGIEQPLGDRLRSSDFARIANSIGRLKSTALATDAWPDMGEDAYHGLAGRIVDLVMPTTEGDPVAVLAAVLTWFGTAVGNSPHFYVGSSRHAANLFAVVVGDTSKARKGVTGSTIREVLTPAEPSLVAGNGSSTGEGIIFTLRDARQEWDKKERTFVVADGGVEDKRLLLHESEFARVLRVATRPASTLTAVYRQAWDGDTLRVVVKGDMGGYTATGAHVGVLGNVTLEELSDTLTRGDAENGFANRILWLAVRRSKVQAILPPLGGMGTIQSDLRSALRTARGRGEVPLTRAAEALWVEEYPRLSASRGGLVGKLTDRSEAQARRLGLVYALLDGAPKVDAAHLRAAIAVVDYAAQSAQVIARSRASEDPIEERVLEAIRLAGGSMSRSAISRDLLARHKTASEVDAIRDSMVTKRLIVVEQSQGAGRPSEVWRAL